MFSWKQPRSQNPPQMLFSNESSFTRMVSRPIRQQLRASKPKTSPTLKKGTVHLSKTRTVPESEKVSLESGGEIGTPRSAAKVAAEEIQNESSQNTAWATT